MEGMNKETQEEIERKRELHRVKDKIRNLKKKTNKTGQGTSRQQTGETQPDPEIPEFGDAETMSSGSENNCSTGDKFQTILGRNQKSKHRKSQ